MKIHYFDPSAWIKRHFQETGSEAITELFRTPLTAACCRLGLVEMIATVSRKCHQESLASWKRRSNWGPGWAANRGPPVSKE